MTSQVDSASAAPGTEAASRQLVERHLSGCPRLARLTPPFPHPDPRACTCDPSRIAAAIRPSAPDGLLRPVEGAPGDNHGIKVLRPRTSDSPMMVRIKS